MGKSVHVKLLDKAYKVYKERVKECDDGKNHISPDYDKNICTNCYNRLEYRTVKRAKILKLRANFHPNQQPMDASLLRRINNEEIESMKIADHFSAIRRIRDELESKKGRGLAAKVI